MSWGSSRELCALFSGFLGFELLEQPVDAIFLDEAPKLILIVLHQRRAVEASVDDAPLATDVPPVKNNIGFKVFRFERRLDADVHKLVAGLGLGHRELRLAEKVPRAT